MFFDLYDNGGNIYASNTSGFRIWKNGGSLRFGGGAGFTPGTAASPTPILQLSSAGVVNISTTTDASSASTASLTVAGGVGIGRSLYVGSTTASAAIRLTSSSSQAYQFAYTNAQTTNYHYWGCNYNGSSYAFVLYNQSNVGVYLSNGGTAWTANSDRRLKKEITPIDDSTALNKVLQLRPVSYLMKTDPDDGKKKLGLIAQEVEPVIPEIVSEGTDGMLGVTYTELIPMLIGSVKALEERIKKLEQR
ncbi:hypothetical protein HK104_007982 [Borealophlyctis nickersoniae]|nr:hypothetical protein HK104_007982 [Borealophlyctis nickersoniae]